MAVTPEDLYPQEFIGKFLTTWYMYGGNRDVIARELGVPRRVIGSLAVIFGLSKEKPRTWNLEDILRVRELYLEGRTIKEISAEIGLSEDLAKHLIILATVHDRDRLREIHYKRMMERRGAHYRRVPYKPTIPCSKFDLSKDKLRALGRLGMTVRDIASAYGVPITCIKRLLKSYGIKLIPSKNFKRLYELVTRDLKEKGYAVNKDYKGILKMHPTATEFYYLSLVIPGARMLHIRNLATWNYRIFNPRMFKTSILWLEGREDALADYIIENLADSRVNVYVLSMLLRRSGATEKLVRTVQSKVVDAIIKGKMIPIGRCNLRILKNIPVPRRGATCYGT